MRVATDTGGKGLTGKGQEGFGVSMRLLGIPEETWLVLGGPGKDLGGPKVPGGVPRKDIGASGGLRGSEQPLVELRKDLGVPGGCRYL